VRPIKYQIDCARSRRRGKKQKQKQKQTTNE
jgi:hypothetical protein